MITDTDFLFINDAIANAVGQEVYICSFHCFNFILILFYNNNNNSIIGSAYMGYTHLEQLMSWGKSYFLKLQVGAGIRPSSANRNVWVEESKNNINIQERIN